ncbi:MAG: DsbA family protein [Pseudomonadota bacterium]
MQTRRSLLLVVAALPAAGLLPRLAAAEPKLGDIVLGDPEAPVTVYEYASFTCPHCAAFHNNTFPEIEKNYIETGKVQFILREVYFDRYGLWASMVARCGGERGFYPMADQFLKRQAVWTRSEDIAGEIRKIGRLNGLSPDAMEACLADEDYARSLVERYQETADEHQVRSTPTFIINGAKHSGNMGVADFSALLDAALSG